MADNSEKRYEDQIRPLLTQIYGEEQAASLYMRIHEIMATFSVSKPKSLPWQLTQKDAVLITYGDQFRRSDQSPLKTLLAFCETIFGDAVSIIHILPFFPYTSDDGFSVQDYCAVDPHLGSWEDVSAIARRYRLMVDAVINHCSSRHPWFQGYLKGEPRFSDYFISMQPDADLSEVIRPRALPLLTPFDTARGKRYVWTTFSQDQVDLNFASPQLLVDVLSILLEYVNRGAELIRLDAIAFLWKDPGTSCLHRPRTHQMIRLFRAILDAVAPSVRLVTETNVPHLENLSYFGDGNDEAQLVYNFALPPLVLDAIQSEDASTLSRWAGKLDLPGENTTFLNFLASHDGIGLNPLRGILPEERIEALVSACERTGGFTSYKADPDGSKSPYELNINYFDAMGDPDGQIGEDAQLNRFLTAHSILLCLQGVPGIYVHSLLGSRGWRQGVETLGHLRAINREKFNDLALRNELMDPSTLRSKVLQRLLRMLKVRAEQPPFSPLAGQRILELQSSLFVIARQHPRDPASIYCLHNLSGEPALVDLRQLEVAHSATFIDCLDGNRIPADERWYEIPPYQFRWLARLQP